MQTSQHRVCYENHYQQMCAGISKCQLSSLNSLQLDPPHLMLPGSARKICIVLGHLKMHQTWPLHCLQPQRKWLSFPEHPSKQKYVQVEKKKVRIITNLSGCSPFLYYIPECPDIIPVLPRKWPTSISPLNSSTYKANYLHHLDAKKCGGEQLCFLVIVAHNVRELTCYM